MQMTHIWKIYDLERTISTGVINTITYACESEYNGFGAREVGYLTITGSSSDEGFIPYDNLTEGVVLSWVTGSSEVDVPATETLCSASIAISISASAAITEINGIPW